MELSEEVRYLINTAASKAAKDIFTEHYKNNPRYFGLTDEEYEYCFEEAETYKIFCRLIEDSKQEIEYLHEKGILTEESCEANEIYTAMANKTQKNLLSLAKKHLQTRGKMNGFLSEKHRKRFAKTFKSLRKAS